MLNNHARPTRRSILLAIAYGAFSAPLAAAADDATHIKVTKRPRCDCCDAWVQHLRDNGFTATLVETSSLEALKEHLRVPKTLSSCHTGEIAGYVIEGHVPASAIKRLLAQRPAAIGLSVPGMPADSPGMEGGEPQVYDVLLFSETGQTVFGRYKAEQLLEN